MTTEPGPGFEPGHHEAGQAAPRVLVVDDDLTVSDVVSRYLRREGYEVVSSADGEEALALATAMSPDLVVLDIMLPGLDGLAVCRALRESSPVPVILLTALGAETDRILGLEIGADDYVTKPFSPRELVLRVGSVLRRAQRQPVTAPAGAAAGTAVRHEPTPVPAAYVDGPLRVDLAAHEVELDGELLTLTVREFDLLAFLIAHPRQAYTREELMHEVWGWTFGDQSTVTVHVRRLRQKLETGLQAGSGSEATGRDWAPIATVWGVGYRYDPWGRGTATGQDQQGDAS